MAEKRSSVVLADSETAEEEEMKESQWLPDGAVQFNLQRNSAGFLLRIQSLVVPDVERPFLKITVDSAKLRSTNVKVMHVEKQPHSDGFVLLLFSPVQIERPAIKRLKMVLKDRVVFGKDKKVSKVELPVAKEADYAQPRMFKMVAAERRSSILPDLYRGGIHLAMKFDSVEETLEVVVASCFNLTCETECAVRCYMLPYEELQKTKQISPPSDEPSPRAPKFDHLFQFQTLPRAFSNEMMLVLEIVEAVAGGERTIGRTTIDKRASQKAKYFLQRVLAKKDRFHYDCLTLTV